MSPSTALPHACEVRAVYEGFCPIASPVRAAGFPEYFNQEERGSELKSAPPFFVVKIPPPEAAEGLATRAHAGDKGGMGQPDILCIGAVLWDVIGRAASVMRVGSDVPGRITRVPGGVAMNIAMALRRFDLRPALMTTVGQDAEGDELLRQADARGLITEYVYRSLDLPTDQYMAIEGANGLIAAIADAHSLERAGAKILAPLRGGALTGWTGPVALDGNLTLELLREIAKDSDFAKMDLRIAPASPGKAERLLPFLGHGSATLYVNLEEAGLLCSTTFDTARAGAEALLARGAARVLVTDGGRPSALGSAEGVIEAAPPEVLVTRITGAGDTFMAGHIAAEMSGAAPAAALDAALARAAAHVSGETPL